MESSERSDAAWRELLSKPGLTIHPTHSCFDDAMEFIELRLKEDPTLAHDKRLQVVHARCEVLTGPSAGQVIVHAWAEENGAIFDAGLIEGTRFVYELSPAEFAVNLRIIDATRYTLKDVHRENVRYGTFGPWKDEYIALCRDKQTRSQSTKTNEESKP
jgi:hypothetical protein